MRAREFTEALDQPYYLHWEHSSDGDVSAVAELPANEGHIHILFEPHRDNKDGSVAWGVEFWRNDSQDITGEGDEFRVFATVLQAVSEFVAKYKPMNLSFQATKKVDQGQKSLSRANLYDRLVQRYARASGYRAFRADAGNNVHYELVRINKDVSEGSGFDQEAGIGIDGKSFKFKIRDLVALADNYPVTKLNPQQFSKQIADRDEDSTQSMARAEKADLKYPIIVVKRQNGQLWIADGTHRAHKAILNKLPNINAKIIPIKDMAPFDVKQGVAEDVGQPTFHVSSHDDFETAFEVEMVIDNNNPGFFSYQYFPETDDVENDVYIHSAQYRGQGLGKLLLLKAIETAQQHGLPFKPDRNGISPEQRRVYQSLLNDRVIRMSPDKTITLTSKPGVAEVVMRDLDEDRRPVYHLPQLVLVLDPHFFDQMGRRELDQGVVDQLLDRLKNITRELQQFEPGQKIWVNSPKLQAKLGMRRQMDRNGKMTYLLKTIVKNPRWDNPDPTITVENFADGKKPGRKGLAKRVGVDCKQPVSKLRSVAKNSSGERQRMAHWCANMKSGKNK